MMKTTRRLGMAMLLATAGSSLMGCSSSGESSPVSEGESRGQIALPLTTQGNSGVVYRLRDATFNIYRYGYYAGTAGSPGVAGTGVTAGTGGSGGSGDVITVSSETDPDAATIKVPLEEGAYFVQLLPGWHFEKQTPEGYEAVEATLLSSDTQWLYVSRLTTIFAEYHFGLGEREIWLNGELNIGVVLHEDPSELGYGGSVGTGGFVGTGGSFPAPSAGTWSGGAAPIFTGGAGGATP
jgi:hypothetical protein